MSIFMHCKSEKKWLQKLPPAKQLQIIFFALFVSDIPPKGNGYMYDCV